MKVNLTSFGLPRRDDDESQDAFAVKRWDETVLAVLADGAGGAREGKRAAQKIVKSLVDNYEARPLTWSPQKALTEFTRHINRTLHHESLERHQAAELVSTLSVAVVEGNHLYGLNVGDSRVYVSHEGQMRRVSTDHVINDRAFKHVLSRAIGLESEVEPHCFETELADGDVALLCSDGVTNVLTDEELALKLSHRAPARSIVCCAHERADDETRDDMSAIVIDIAETGRIKAMTERSLNIRRELNRGDVIDGYTLVKPFQHSDRVWLATRDGQRFSLKFAPVEALDNEAVLHQFVKETWNATRIDGEFFVDAFVPEDATARYYVMEFVEAPSLKTLLRSRRLAVEETIALGKFLLQAGQHLLHFDLVHGDIKPENILVLPGYDSVHFKLVDFGSATEVFSVTSRAGTASYLAPERFHEAPIAERTEVFAIGVTLFQALTGALPFGEIERFQTPHFHVPKRLSRLNANVAPWLEAVIHRAIAIEPKKRAQHYSEVLFGLEHPEQVEPIELPADRDALRFYRLGFYALLALTIYLVVRLLQAGVRLP